MSWLSGLFGKRKREKELEEEVRSHLEMAARERAERGEKKEEAEHAARRKFGNVELVKQVTRDVWGWTWLRDVADDVRYGLRMLLKNPGFTAVAVLTLALGIGANAAILNTANVVLWRALPVADPHSLVRLIAVRQDNTEHESIPIGIAEELHRSRNIFSDVITRSDDGLSFSYKGGATERVVGEVVSPNFFDSLGIRLALGQGFSAAVQKGQWAPEIVLSYRFWQRRFGSGLMAFSVAQRTREIGIRVALGADRKRILSLVAWQGMKIVFIGVALGLPASFLLTHLMAGMLYNVHPDDPVSFATVTFALGMVSLLACYIPARRAMKVDPMVALRYE